MVFKAYLPDGRIVCSSCKSEVKEKDRRCEICLSLLEVDKEGMECPYCKKIVDRYAPICEYCGKVLREEPQKQSGGLDEEFLLKLLDLGKKVEKESPEDIEERAKAVEVIKAVAGVVDEKQSTLAEREKPQIKQKIEERAVEEIKGKTIRLPEELRNLFLKILEQDIVELRKKLDTLPQGTFRDALTTFLETISSAAETKIGGEIGEEKILQEFASLLIENLECINSVLDQYSALLKVQSGVDEASSKSTQGASGKISKKDWLAAQRQVQAELFKVKKELDEEAEKRVKKATKKAEEEIERLKSKINELTEENERLRKSAVSPEEIEELRTLLKTLDDLLGELPDAKIEEFAKSEKFKLYEKILDKYKVGED
ncbi:MAG: hypothetical protein QXJ27_02715 [Thermoplasmata archaeon]